MIGSRLDIFGAVLVVVLCGYCFCFAAGASDLRLVIELCRHGDRGPIVLFPKDTYYSNPRDVNAWPIGLGQLTGIGMKQHYELGQKLRQKYIVEENLLEEVYDYEKILIRTTSVDRTVMSAISQMMGLFNGTGPSDALPYKYQPIALTNVPKDENDYLLRSYEPHCNRLSWDIDKNLVSSEEARALDEKYTKNQFYERMKEATGLTDAVMESRHGDGAKLSVKYISSLADELVCNEAHGVTGYLEGGKSISESDVQTAKRLFDFQASKMFSGKEASQLSIGFFVDEVINRLNDATNDVTKYRFLLYSAHDTTVSAFLCALKLDDVFPTEPSYASHILLELRGPSTAPYVSVSYYTNDTDNIAIPLPFCDHKKECPLDEFASGLQNVRIQSVAEWTEICEKQTSNRIKYSGTKPVAFVIGASVSVFLLAVFVFMWKQRQKKDEKRAVNAIYHGLRLNPDEVPI